MRPLMLAVISLLALTATPVLAQSLLGDPQKGYEIAQERCASCHLIEKGITGRGGKNAPAFQAVADDPAVTEMSLKVFLRTPHRHMPNLILAEEESDDIASYILSLK